jgi:hypothetical protein
MGAPTWPGERVRRRVPAAVADRVSDRPAPRLGISLAGVGVGLVIVGVVVWGGTYVVEGPLGSGLFGSGGGGGSSRHYLGALLAFVVVVIGYALAIGARRGPLASAGLGAAAIGVPVLFGFLTFDGFAGGTSINIDAVTWVSIAVWLASYFLVRGAQGHAFLIGLTAVLLWVYALDKVGPGGANLVSAVPGVGDAGLSARNFDSAAGVSLMIGLVYYLIAAALDASGRRGIAVPFVLVGFPAVTAGVFGLSGELHLVGVGLMLFVIGLLFAWYGARTERRFTTWAWAVGAALGAGLVVGKIVEAGGGAAIGAALIVLGALFVVGAALLARALGEPDDVAPAPVAGARTGLPVAPPYSG